MAEKNTQEEKVIDLNKTSELNTENLNSDLNNNSVKENAKATVEKPVEEKTDTLSGDNENKRVHRFADKPKKLNPLIIVGSAVVAIIVIALIVMFSIAGVRHSGGLGGLFAGNYTKGDVNKVAFYPTKLATDVTNTKEETSFKQGNPILLELKLKNPADQKIYTYEVINKKDNSSIRKGTFPVAHSDSQDELPRYITIVSTERNVLGTGDYKVILKESDSEVASWSFKVTN
ncbi:MAG: hypothetical protein LBM13_04055 [Candidatus Ancillula sp.]|jgi:hypothetical protein|nr:hypothetical protein [Candidatus Ancillula sp.]